MVFRFTFTIFDTNVTEKDDAKATYRSSFSRSLIRGCLNSLYNPLFLHNMCGEIGYRMVFRFTFTIFDKNVTEKDDAKATYRSSFSQSLIRGCLNSLYNPLFLQKSTFSTQYVWGNRLELYLGSHLPFLTQMLRKIMTPKLLIEAPFLGA